MNFYLSSAIEISWWLLPAAVANVAPVIAAAYGWLPAFALPVDGGLKWHGRRMLGNHKTVRGFMMGVIFGLITAVIQYYVGQYYAWSNNDVLIFSSLGWAVWWGNTSGLLALVGDAVKSFAKRQRNISSGKPWRPFDQIDYIVLPLVVAWFALPLTPTHVVLAFIIFGIASYVTSAVGVALQLKKTM